jgi:hypothetical protein
MITMVCHVTEGEFSEPHENIAQFRAVKYDPWGYERSEKISGLISVSPAGKAL